DRGVPHPTGPGRRAGRAIRTPATQQEDPAAPPPWRAVAAARFARVLPSDRPSPPPVPRIAEAPRRRIARRTSARERAERLPEERLESGRRGARFLPVERGGHRVLGGAGIVAEVDERRDEVVLHPGGALRG